MCPFCGYLCFFAHFLYNLNFFEYQIFLIFRVLSAFLILAFRFFLYVSELTRYKRF